VSVFEAWRDGESTDHPAGLNPGLLSGMVPAMFCSATVCQHVIIDQYLVITSGVLAVGTAITFAIAHSAWLTIFHHRAGSAAVIADRKEAMSNMRGCPHASRCEKGRKV
jgi:hypothetical protein